MKEYCKSCGIVMREVGCAGIGHDKEHDCEVRHMLYQCPQCNRVDLWYSWGRDIESEQVK